MEITQSVHDNDHHYIAPQVVIPPEKPLSTALKSNLRETLFSDDPFRPFQNQPGSKQFILGLKYFFSILEWGPKYKLSNLKSDLIAGITISSLAVPQGISYATLCNMPPMVGIYMSFVPPLVYAILGTSRHMAIGPMAVSLVLLASLVSQEVSPKENPKLYMQIAFTSTFFAGIFQTFLGFLRLGFVVDFLSQATVVGFMAGAAITVILQQFKGFLGIENFTQKSDVISVIISIFTQFHEWKWQPAVMGFCFLSLLILSRKFSMKRPSMFWVSAVMPLFCVIMGSLIVFITDADRKYNIQAIGVLQKGLNPTTMSDLSYIIQSKHLTACIKIGLITGMLVLAEGIACGRSFAAIENYHIDGSKEMIAIGMMNIVGSCTSCPIASGIFSRTAVNYNAGGKTQLSPIVMAIMMLLTILFMTPLFQYTPLVSLSCIITVAMYSVMDVPAAIQLWKVDKIDCMACVGACLGYCFGSVLLGLAIGIGISLLRLILYITRPRTLNLGNIPNTRVYRSVDQYVEAVRIPGVMILQIDSPIYFANSNYLRERVSRWMYEEEDRIKASNSEETELHYLILDLSTVGGIDSSGVKFLQELKKSLDRSNIKLLLANPRSEVIKKLDVSEFIEKLGRENMFVTVNDAVISCKFLSHSNEDPPAEDRGKPAEENV